MPETSGPDGGQTGVLLSRECGVEAGDAYLEDEAQDRFGKGQTYLQQEARNGRACLWEYLLHLRVEPIYASREGESEHPMVTLLCGAQSL